MQILDAHGRATQLRRIEFVRTEGIINGIESVAFHIRGASEGEVIAKADLTERVEMEIMERLTERFDYLGEPIT